VPVRGFARRLSAVASFSLDGFAAGVAAPCRPGRGERSPRALARRSVLVPFVRPVACVRALRADACARGGTGRRAGRSLTVTTPQGSARATVPG
jgi:hypothetical protein